MEFDKKLTSLRRQKEESENLRKVYDNRWSRNLKLYKGIFREQETSFSKVRQREKIFFRKIWATVWRLVASMYYAFLKDPEAFKIEGRDTLRDPLQAQILQKMVEYRRDRMYAKDSLFIKFIWAFLSIFNYGWVCGKLCWEYKEGKTDEPKFILYPNEQVFPDLKAWTKEQMRYIHFLNYMTKEEMEERGYKNLDDIEIASPDFNQLRQTRYMQDRDPLQNPGENEYPKPGTYEEGSIDSNFQVYKVFESFWFEKGEVKFGIHNNFKVWLKEPENSPYGDTLPGIMGTCLTEMHKLFGEGFPEPLESPQESYNYILNMRKDNVAQAMAGHTFVNRYGNVDLESLINRRVAGYTLMDDVEAVKHERVPDVTQSAYMEAAADDGMMQEMSGVTAGKVGMERAEKATVAQINFTEANAKIDLYIALVGETFMKDFYAELARQIQRFETDEMVFRIANDRLKQEIQFDYGFDVYDLGIEADVIVNVGAGSVGREIEIKQILLAMDRAIITMQAAGNLAKLGAIPPGGMKIPNVMKFFELLLPKLGHKNINDFFINLQQPQMQPGGGQGAGGALQPQIGDMNMPTDMNMVQEGGQGG